MLSRPVDTPDRTLPTQNTRKRTGYRHPPGFTGGNLEGVCVPSALWRPEAHVRDPYPLTISTQAQQKGTPHA
jgi:hypothetical protein